MSDWLLQGNFYGNDSETKLLVTVHFLMGVSYDCFNWTLLSLSGDENRIFPAQETDELSKCGGPQLLPHQAEDG